MIYIWYAHNWYIYIGYVQNLIPTKVDMFKNSYPQNFTCLIFDTFNIGYTKNVIYSKWINIWYAQNLHASDMLRVDVHKEDIPWNMNVCSKSTTTPEIIKFYVNLISFKNCPKLCRHLSALIINQLHFTNELQNKGF